MEIMLLVPHLRLCKLLMGMNCVGHFKEKHPFSIQETKNFMLLMFLPTYGRYFFLFFFILTDMWLLLVLKETYTRVKGKKKHGVPIHCSFFSQILFTVSLQLCSKTNQESSNCCGYLKQNLWKIDDNF